jgi:hypothetical protein
VRHVRLTLETPRTENKKYQRQDSVMLLCMSFSNLRAIELGSHHVCASLMVGLTQLPYLARLSMQLLDGCSADVIPLINDMHNLKELAIDCDTDDLDIWPLDRPIVHPSILNLTLQGPDDASALMKYLACCRVHPSCQIFLKLREPCSDLSNMAPFIAAHTFCKVQLDLYDDDDENLGTICDSLSRIPHVVFLDPMTMTNIFVDQLSLPTVIELEIDDIFDPDIYWDFFDGIFQQRVRLVTAKSPSTIRIYSNTITVAWAMAGRNDDDDKAAFVGRLLRYALLFYKHGVYVVDHHWRDIRDVLRAPIQPCACGLHEAVSDGFTLRSQSGS